MGSAQPPTSGPILVVEPDVLTRMVVSDYLRECGYKVVEAVSAEEAIAILSEPSVKVAALFSEVKLKGEMDGFGLAQWVRSKISDVEIILTSSVAMTAYKAAEVCEEGPLEKPYHPQQLLQRLKVLWERRRSALK